MSDMKKLDEFLEQAGCFHLATVDGDIPRCRPLGLHHFYEGQIYYGIGDFKDVYRQLQANPNTEIVATKGMSWVRVNGKAVFVEDSDPVVAEILETFPLKKLYEEHGWTLKIFRLEDAEVQFIDIMTVKESFHI